MTARLSLSSSSTTTSGAVPAPVQPPKITSTAMTPVFAEQAQPQPALPPLPETHDVTIHVHHRGEFSDEQLEALHSAALKTLEQQEKSGTVSESSDDDDAI